jgi:hypothetical protein
MDKTRNQFNKKFIERMRQAANHARVLGDNALAEALNNEATDYEEAQGNHI